VGPEPGEVEPDHHALLGEPFRAECVANRAQRDVSVEVLGGDLEPPGPPRAERLADLEQLVAGLGELLAVTSPPRLRCRLDDA